MNYKFDEDKTLETLALYIKNTYDAHYAKDKKYQATDMIFDSGYGEGFCLGNIMKYAMRYKYFLYMFLSATMHFFVVWKMLIFVR